MADSTPTGRLAVPHTARDPAQGRTGRHAGAPGLERNAPPRRGGERGVGRRAGPAAVLCATAFPVTPCPRGRRRRGRRPERTGAAAPAAAAWSRRRGSRHCVSGGSGRRREVRARVGHPYGTVLDGRVERANEAPAPSEVRGHQGTVHLIDIHRDFGDAGRTPPCATRPAGVTYPARPATRYFRPDFTAPRASGRPPPRAEPDHVTTRALLPPPHRAGPARPWRRLHPGGAHRRHRRNRPLRCVHGVSARQGAAAPGSAAHPKAAPARSRGRRRAARPPAGRPAEDSVHRTDFFRYRGLDGTVRPPAPSCSGGAGLVCRHTRE
ncbi:hypothetical protein SGLAM104S_08781 [Streptomyces glaucescens]